MVADDRSLLGGDPKLLSRANKRFHKQIHLASHNRFLVQQLDLVHRSMALMAHTSFAAEGRDATVVRVLPVEPLQHGGVRVHDVPVVFDDRLGEPAQRLAVAG